MRGLIGGVVSGGLVSALALSVVSIVSEQPAGVTPPETPLIDAPQVDGAPDPETGEAADNVSTPVGSLSVDAPQAPALPDSEAALTEPESPIAVQAEQSTPQADTDPLDEPEVVSIEGGLAAPETSQTASLQPRVIDPVLPNPQSIAPATPVTESNVTVSTAPAAPVIVADPQVETPLETSQDDRTNQDDGTNQDGGGTDNAPSTGRVVIEGSEPEEAFVVTSDVDVPVEPEGGSLADATQATETAPRVDAPFADTQTPTEPAANEEPIPTEDAVAALETPASDQTTTDVPVEAETPDDTVSIADATPDAEADPVLDDAAARALADDNRDQATAPPTSRFQLQGEGDTVLGSQNSGAIVRRFGDSSAADAQPEAAPTAVNALSDFAAPQVATDERPLLSFVLIDDGTMSAASAALAGLPFNVTIALDPAMEGATDMLNSYRADGFEVAVLAKVPAGALPSDVEVTFESVFRDLPETIAVLDIGDGGYQTDRDVTAQAMEILASQGRGFVTAGRGLNMAGRAAELAGVPSVVIHRDLDADDQDARVVRRFVDQAAFRARQESGVILIGRVRPDTISALILWATANQNDQVAIVPLSTVLNAQ